MAQLKTYSISTDITSETLNISKLSTEISSSGNVTGFEGLLSEGDSVIVLGTALANESALNALVLAHEAVSLTEYKQIKIDAIDTRSEELIGLGYTYATKQFSLSPNAQTNILAMHSSKDDPAIIYPITFNAKDDLSTYNVPDAADLHVMYLTALGTKKARLDSGTTLKNQVRAATTKAEVDAIIDNR